MKYWIMMLCAALTLTFAGDAHAESAKDRPVTKTHVTKLTGKELKQLSKDGEEGNAEAALRLYYYYQFVKEDRTQAVSWLKRADENGSSKARRMLRTVCANDQCG